MEPADEREQLAPGHPAVEPRVLVEVADVSVELGHVQADLDACNGGAPGAGLGESGEDPDGRGLARSVRAEEAEDRARGYGQIEAVEGED